MRREQKLNLIIAAMFLLFMLFLLWLPGYSQEIQTVNPDTAVFAWDPPTEGDPADGYRLLWGTESGYYPEISDPITGLTVPMSQFSFTRGTIYFAVVQAFNEAGSGPYSNEVIFRPLAVPGAAVLRIQ